MPYRLPFWASITTANTLALSRCFFFFFNDTATTEIYTLSLHDALPIYKCPNVLARPLLYLISTKRPNDTPEHCMSVSPVPATTPSAIAITGVPTEALKSTDRKSTRLNSSHQIISYAVFCLKKKKHNSDAADMHKTHRLPVRVMVMVATQHALRTLARALAVRGLPVAPGT